MKEKVKEKILMMEKEKMEIMQLGKGEEGLSRRGCHPPESPRSSRGAPPPAPPVEQRMVILAFYTL